MEPNELQHGPRDTHIFNHDGSLLLDLSNGKGPEIIAAALVVACRPVEAGGGEMALIWRVHSSMTFMASALARFFILNPAFYQAVEANVAMLATGRMDGGMGDGTDQIPCTHPGCPVHGPVQPPEPEA